MFEHLQPFEPDLNLHGSFAPVSFVAPEDLFNAMNNTVQALHGLGVIDDEDLEAQEQDRSAAKAAVDAMLHEEQRAKRYDAVVKLNRPAAVAYASTMLHAYDWDFIEQAQNIRAYVVTKLIEESDNAKSKPGERLKALELLGKVGEVGLFQDRIKIDVAKETTEALEARLEEKLRRLQIIDVEDVKEVKKDE
jgi:hypothetical protein